MTRVLCTGAAGFLGSHTLAHLVENTDWDIVGMVSFRHQGDSLRLTQDHRIHNNPRVKIVTHDLVGPISKRLSHEIGDVDYIMNIASESDVYKSIQEPVPVFRNNVDLILNMLEYARTLPHLKSFIQVSSDEVYGACAKGESYAEWSPINPSNPYSASKAAQEAAVISYWRTYGVSAIICNAMNLIGEKQSREKFIPMCISRVLSGEKIIIHASDKGEPGSRCYLHARNYSDAMLWAARNVVPEKAKGGPQKLPRFNVTGEMEIDNLTLAKMISGWVGKPLNYELDCGGNQRPGHDLFYFLNGELIRSKGWTAPVKLIPSLKKTVEWTLNHREWLL